MPTGRLLGKASSYQRYRTDLLRRATRLGHSHPAIDSRGGGMYPRKSLLHSAWRPLAPGSRAHEQRLPAIEEQSADTGSGGVRALLRSASGMLHSAIYSRQCGLYRLCKRLDQSRKNCLVLRPYAKNRQRKMGRMGQRTSHIESPDGQLQRLLPARLSKVSFLLGPSGGAL